MSDIDQGVTAKSLFRATPSIVIDPMIPSETRLEYILDANCSISASVSIDFNWSGRAEINVPTIRLSESVDELSKCFHRVSLRLLIFLQCNLTRSFVSKSRKTRRNETNIEPVQFSLNLMTSSFLASTPSQPSSSI